MLKATVLTIEIINTDFLLINNSGWKVSQIVLCWKHTKTYFHSSNRIKIKLLASVMFI